MIRKIVTALAASALLVGVALAVDNDRGPHTGKHHERPMAGGALMRDDADPGRLVRHLGRELSLTDEQQQLLDNIVSSAQPEIDALRKRADAQRKVIRELDVNDPDYASKLQNAATASGDLASQAILLHGRLRKDIDATLTPEQRDQLKAKRDERLARWKERRDRKES